MSRSNLFDSLKYILVILVIYGHVIEPYRGNSQILLALHSFIYTFHMPLFIFLSGYFSKNINSEKLKKWSVKSFETYAVFQILFTLITVLYFNYSFSVFNFFVIPYFALWYIFALILWRIAIFFLKNYSKFLILTLSILISLLAGFIEAIGYEFTLSKTIVFFPYFIVGYYAADFNINYIRKIPKFYSFAFLTLLLIIYYNYSDVDTIKVLAASRPYTVINENEFIGLFYRVIFYILSIPACISIINIAPSNDFLASYGKNSTVFYIYHMLFLFIINKIIAHFDLIPSFLTLSFAAVIVILILMIGCKISFINNSFNPISNWVKKSF